MLLKLVQFSNPPPPIKVTDAPRKVFGTTTFPDADEPTIKYAVFPEALIRYFMEA